MVASTVAGIALALLRYDANCLAAEFRFLIGFLNGLLVFGTAAVFVQSSRPVPIAPVLLLVSLVSAAVSHGLLTRWPGVGELLLVDLVVLVVVPVALGFACTVYVLRVMRTLSELRKRLSENTSTDSPAAALTEPEPKTEPGDRPALRFRTEGRWQSLPLDRVIYIASRGKRCTVHSLDGDFETPTLLKDLLTADSSGPILRIHKSFAVNRRFVDPAGVRHRFGGSYYLRLLDEDDSELPVGRRYLGELRARPTA